MHIGQAGEQRGAFVIRRMAQRKHGMQRGIFRPEAFIGVEKIGQQPPDFAAARAGEDAEDRHVLRQTERGAGVACGDRLQAVAQRVADADRRHAVLVVHRGFKRKEAEHEVNAAANFVDALFFPCPQRRADVMHRLHAARVQGAGDAQVEIGGVDADEHIRRVARPMGKQRFLRGEDVRQVAQHLDQPHHREAVHVNQRIKPRRLHRRAADAAEARIGQAFAQGSKERCAEQVAGGFAREQGDVQGFCGHGFLASIEYLARGEKCNYTEV